MDDKQRAIEALQKAGYVPGYRGETSTQFIRETGAITRDEVTVIAPRGHTVRMRINIVRPVDEALSLLHPLTMETVTALRNLVSALDDLIASSDGVAGLHRNGDVATWGELTTGGRFEGWLMALDEARDLLTAMEQKGGGEE